MQYALIRRNRRVWPIRIDSVCLLNEQTPGTEYPLEVNTNHILRALRFDLIEATANSGTLVAPSLASDTALLCTTLSLTKRKRHSEVVEGPFQAEVISPHKPTLVNNA